MHVSGWCAVGDDGDDMMDDVHNSRLRERAKKEGGHGVATSTVGPSSRNKRKRQGSQEMQVLARNSPADEVEETTEDTEMGVSEDDDDPPPPIIIPRRPGKPRPQAKVRAWAWGGMGSGMGALERVRDGGLGCTIGSGSAWGCADRGVLVGVWGSLRRMGLRWICQRCLGRRAQVGGWVVGGGG